jgi:hypothetical protein
MPWGGAASSGSASLLKPCSSGLRPELSWRAADDHVTVVAVLGHEPADGSARVGAGHDTQGRAGANLVTCQQAAETGKFS